VSQAAASIKASIRARVLCSPMMADVPIVLDTEVMMKGALDRAIAEAIAASGKTGVFGIVTIPTARDAYPTPESPLCYSVAVQFHEDPLTNRSAGGTGYYAETLAAEAYAYLRHFQFRGASSGSGCFVCNPVPNPLQWLKESLSKWSYQARVDVQSLQQDYLGMVAPPAISITDGAATITAAAGTAIYCTLDGTFPSPRAGAALYAGPFAVASGQTVLACAYLDTFLPSIVTALTAP
jgi:hypothetical protein